MATSLILVIHNVRSAHNVGSLFRTADGVGVERVLLTGYTPAPPEKDKLFYTPAEKAFQKTALGAERSVPWEKFRLFRQALRKYRKKDYRFIALEQTPESVDYRSFPAENEQLPKSSIAQKLFLALVVGNEVRGLDARIVRQCERAITLPMRGKKNSLNVAVAAGIALYHLSDRIERQGIGYRE